MAGMSADHPTNPHEHGHDHSELGEMDLRVRALESVLTQKGYIDPAALDALIDTYQTRIGPRNGRGWWRGPGSIESFTTG